MRSVRRVALVACLMLLIASFASMVAADSVRCTPIVKDGKIIGYSFRVCNKFEDPCTEAGCIYDVHIQIRSGCTIRRIGAIPPDWTGVIRKDRMGVSFVTPPPTGGTANPIYPGTCKRFNVLTDCSTEGCFTIAWQTTGPQGEILDQGTRRCCPPSK